MSAPAPDRQPTWLRSPPHCSECDREPERVLEVGTGTGAGALLVAREFPHARVRGVDISPEMIRRAQNRIGLDPEGRVAFKVADAANLPYEDESFDLVVQLNTPPSSRRSPASCARAATP